jgi:hypothetical protein
LFQTDEEGKMVIEMKGRCFNATLTARKHTTRCPWCPDPNLQIAVSQQVTEGDNAGSHQMIGHILGTGGDSLIVIVALCGLIVLLTTLLCALFVIHFRRRRFWKKNYRAGKPRPQQFLYHQQRPLPPPTHQIAEPLKGRHYDHRDEQRYEVPWDNKYRSLHYWLPPSGNGVGSALRAAEMTVSPPLDATSVIGSCRLSEHMHSGTSVTCGTMSRRTSPHGPQTTLCSPKPPATLHEERPYELSPNSSSSFSRHDDSGLESV